MKLVILLSVLFAAQAQAFELTELANLPTLQNVKLEIVHGPGMAAVQPVGVINFTYRSCAPRSFVEEVEEINGVYYVKISDQNQMDCMGSTQERPYSVQYSSDAKGTEGVVILNPQSVTSNWLI